MAKLTLLEMVQSILSDMSSDKVNSISDTVEAEQVVSIIKDTYFNMLNTLDKIPEHMELTQLEALGDSTRPNYLLIPSNILDITWIKYNTSTDGQKAFTTIDYICPEEFLDRTYGRNSTSDNIIEVNDVDSNVSLLIQNDKMPDFWTVFNDQYIVFDSYDSSVEDTLEKSRSLIYAQTEPTWTSTDTFVPALDSNLFPLLLADAKSLCFINLKEVGNPKIEKIATNQRISMQNKKKKTTNRFDYPNYGRTPTNRG